MTPNLRISSNNPERSKRLSARSTGITGNGIPSDRKHRMKMGGFMGEIAYEGELREFWPYIRLGE